MAHLVRAGGLLLALVVSFAAAPAPSPVVVRETVGFDRAGLSRSDGLPITGDKAAQLVGSSGWVEFDFQTPKTGWYELWLRGMPTSWVRDIHVDGEAVLLNSTAAVEDAADANKPDACFKESNLHLSAGKHVLRITRTAFPGKFPASWELRPTQGGAQDSIRIASVADSIVAPGESFTLELMGGSPAGPLSYEISLKSLVDQETGGSAKVDFPATDVPLKRTLSVRPARPGAYVLTASSGGKTLRPADLKCPPLIMSAAVAKPSAEAIAPRTLSVAGVFGDGMVVQRDVPMPVWGWAVPDAAVSVQFAGQSRSTTADAQGRWQVTFEPLKAGGPYSMEAKAGGQTVRINEILAGEVWLMGGQSNMGGPLGQSIGGTEAVETAKFPAVRMAKAFERVAGEKGDPRPLNCAWQAADLAKHDRKALLGWNAIPFAFGIDLHRRLNVPVGMIVNNRGGTFIATWTSIDAQRAEPAFKPSLSQWEADSRPEQVHSRVAARVPIEIRAMRDREAKEAKAANRAANTTVDVEAVVKRLLADQYRNRPASLFESLVRPLAPFPFRGVVWYQGESDSNRACAYPAMLKALVGDWRKLFGNEAMDFVVVQIAYGNGAPYQGEPADARFGEMQEAQATILSTPHTSIMTTYDLPRPDDNVHYLDKLPVGHRAALAALRNTYGMSDVQAIGPRYKSMKVEGQKVRLSFAGADGGLVAKDQKAGGFAIAGEDRVFHWAQATIDGEDVLVSSDRVAHPVAVRYGWATSPCGANLYGKNGLPVLVFRTDDWPLSTLGK